MNRSVDSLRKSAKQENIRATVSLIADKILISEFEEAASLTDALLADLII
jgi:DNA repair photolyase